MENRHMEKAHLVAEPRIWWLAHAEDDFLGGESDCRRSAPANSHRSRADAGGSYISLIEGSQRRLDLVEFHEIARAIGADPVRLFAEISALIDRDAKPTGGS
jgi:hypothetical protein